MKICAVVVTYNRSNLMQECISALKSQNSLAGIVVVNNNSTDETKQVLDSMSSDFIHVVHMTENTGGAGGFHVGLKKSVELGYDASWIMDDDAIPQQNALLELTSAAEYLNWEFGFLTSNVQTNDGECMNVPSIDLRPNSSGYSDWAKHADNGLIKVEIATFVSVLIKNNIAINLGLPIREMFIWGDDSEYTQRVSKKHECYFVSRSKVVHKRVLASALSIATESNPLRISWFKLLYRNNLYRIRKHGSTKDLIKLLLSALRSAFVVMKSDSPMKIKRLSAIITGCALGFTFDPKVTYPTKQ